MKTAIEIPALRLQIKWMVEHPTDAWTFKFKTKKARSRNFHEFFPDFHPGVLTLKYDKLTYN